jgi:nucleotide sugar dehydrogenase
MIRLGFIGNGFVGSAGRQLECPKNNAIVYDIDPEKCVPLGTTLEQVANCDVVFVSVPTPAEADGSCHLSIVETVVKQLKTARTDCPIILRSTVPPGTSKRLGVSFMPEFLTEANHLEDFRQNPLWVYGGTSPERIQSALTNAKEAGKIVSDQMVQMTTQEAELVKYVRNCFLATKVSFFNEVEQYCRTHQIDYDTVRERAAADARIGLSHTKVPGPDGRRGFGGHCFPKDMAAWCHFAPSEHSIVRAAHERNLQVDRPEKDWQKDKGRAVVDTSK